MRSVAWFWILGAWLYTQDADRNFAGQWRLASEDRDFGTLPVPPATFLDIRHTPGSIECVPAPGETPEQGCFYTTGGSENKVHWTGGRISSRVKWEGRSLLVNSIVTGPRNYTLMDRWTLSNDRNTLRIRRQIVGAAGRDAESTLVYVRVTDGPPPVSPAVAPASVPAGATRYGRRMLRPIGAVKLLPGQDGYAIAQKSGDIVVSCLAYEDAARTYIELTIRNSSDAALALAPGFITVAQPGRSIPRTDTLRASDEIQRAAAKPFTPTPTGKNPRTGYPVYERSLVEQQARKHIAAQEQESSLAALLAAAAQTGPTEVHRGSERTFVCTFGPRAAPDPITVTVRAGPEPFQFQFQD